MKKLRKGTDTDDRIAIPLSELKDDPRIPWGRDKIIEHADAGLLPTFFVGRRRFVAAADLSIYVENLRDESRA